MQLSYYIIAICMGILSSYLAIRRNRNPFIWFIVGSVFGLLGICFLFLGNPRKKPEPKPVSIELQSFIDGPTHHFWYYLDSENQQIGPMSHQALSQDWKQGKITPTTLVWNEELSEWKALSDFIKVTSSP